MCHDLEHIEVVSYAIGCQQNGSVGVKFHGHHSFVMRYEMSDNSRHFFMEVDLVLPAFTKIANLQDIQNGDYALLHVLRSARTTGSHATRTRGTWQT